MTANCREFKNCGRESGGRSAGSLGVCVAASAKTANGTNGGTNGGRICWALAGTLCGGKPQGTFAQKMAECLKCDFYTAVRLEQGPRLVSIVAH